MQQMLLQPQTKCNGKIKSFGVIRKKELPFEMHKTDIGVHGRTLRKMVGLGAPIALQDLLVSISFLIILAIVNSMGVTASAGVGAVAGDERADVFDE